MPLHHIYDYTQKKLSYSAFPNFSEISQSFFRTQLIDRIFNSISFIDIILSLLNVKVSLI